MTPMARPIAPPVMPLIEFLDALVDIVGGSSGEPLRSRPPCCRWKCVWLRVEQRFVEAAVQPAAPFAMQGRGEKMPDAGEAGVLEDHEEDQQCRRW